MATKKTGPRKHLSLGQKVELIEWLKRDDVKADIHAANMTVGQVAASATKKVGQEVSVGAMRNIIKAAGFAMPRKRGSQGKAKRDPDLVLWTQVARILHLMDGLAGAIETISDGLGLEPVESGNIIDLAKRVGDERLVVDELVVAMAKGGAE